MKNDLLLRKTFHETKKVIEKVTVAVDFYNKLRQHMSIERMTPAQTSETDGDQDMR